MKIKWFSLSDIISNIILTGKRFPLTILFTLITVGLVIYNLQQKQPSIIFEKLVMTSFLIAVYSISLHLITERKIKVKVFLIPIVIAMGVLAFLFFYMDGSMVSMSISYRVRFAALLTIGHLLAAIIPYDEKNSISIFSCWNVHLLSRFIQAYLFSLILFGGLSLADFSMDKLFDFSLLSYRHGHLNLFVLILGLFHTPYFLSGIPQLPVPKSIVNEKGKILKVITSYILTPIVCVYGLILYAYSIKTIMNAGASEDWVVYLQFWFFALGVFTYLLHTRLAFFDNEKISSFYKKWFFPISVPLLLFFTLKVYTLIQAYGLSIERYLQAMVIACISIFIAFIAVKRRHDIRIFPLILIVAALVSWIGPTSMVSSIKRNQKDRLVKSLRADGLIVNDILLQPKNKSSISETSRESIKALLEVQGTSFLEKYDKNDVLVDSLNGRDMLSWTYKTAVEDVKDIRIYKSNEMNAVNIEKYHRLIPYNALPTAAQKESLNFDKENGLTYQNLNKDLSIDFGLTFSFTDTDPPMIYLERESIELVILVRYAEVDKSSGHLLRLDPVAILIADAIKD